MSSIITLNGIVVELTSDLGRAFITDACRAGESVIDDSTLIEKYDLSIEELQAIANTKAVGRAIRNEREHRLRSGIATRELASGYFFKVPKVLDSILSDEQANARHRIESARELRVISTPENQSNPAAQSERFHIVINLGSDVEVYNKSIAVNADDAPPEQLKSSGQPRLTIISNDGSDNE
jgi:hypothetical protein